MFWQPVLLRAKMAAEEDMCYYDDDDEKEYRY